MPGRIVLLVTSPRVAPGLLSRAGWQAVEGADEVLHADPGPGWDEVLADARDGRVTEDLGAVPVAEQAGLMVERAMTGRTVLWLSSADGDPGLTDALAEHLARHAVTGAPPEVELITGSHDVPGSRLLDVVAVMDRLRSPGGCPWDATPTHTSLLPYLLEETHEVIEVVQDGDRVGLVEELGDLLFQVVFHARLGEEHEQSPFGIDEVAAGIVAKLVRRHPHVFADVEADTPEAVEQNWEQIKAAEKPDRGPLDGIPATLPALARAQKVLGRLGDPEVTDPELTGPGVTGPAVPRDEAEVGQALLALVARARAAGVDAESALDAAIRRLALG
jgi:XTP/dITP diphosphohydrolase